MLRAFGFGSDEAILNSFVSDDAKAYVKNLLEKTQSRILKRLMLRYTNAFVMVTWLHLRMLKSISTHCFLLSVMICLQLDVFVSTKIPFTSRRQGVGA